MSTPDESQSRDYEVFVRGPVATMRFAFTSTDTDKAYRGGIWHQSLLAAFPAPTDNELSDFGIQAGGGCTIEISDETGDADWFLLLGDGDSFLQLGDGSRLVLGY